MCQDAEICRLLGMPCHISTVTLIAPASGLSFGLAANLDINPTNISSMARVLDAANKQSISGQYSDDLGF